MKITLSNGKVFETLGVHGRSMLYQGVQRDSLIFMFDPEKVTMEDVIQSFTEDNCLAITITDDEGNVFVHENYTIRIEAGIGYKEMVTSGSVSGMDESKSVYVRMAQTTLAERTIQQQQDTIDALVIAVLEG